MKIYKCNICMKVIEVFYEVPVPTVCCNEDMELMEANTSDGAAEKHLPIYQVDKLHEGMTVTVGENIHPMEDNHYIMWIAQVIDNIVTRVDLNPGDEPIGKFKYIKGSTIYAYCDKHGLWKAEVN